MRCSLFLPADTIPDRLRSQAYVLVEQRAVAAELSGFSAVWLADQWARVPPRLPASLALARQLSVVTDRVDLGLILRLPTAALRPLLLAELCTLDDLAYGRLRIALDLRGLGADEHAAGLALLATLAERLDGRRSPNLARRLALVVDDASAAPAAAYGVGLLLAPGDHLHERRLWLARYNEGRAAGSGWVTRLLTVAVGADDDELARLRRTLSPDSALLSTTAEPTLVGLPAQLTAQLAVAQIADGLDEVICAVVPTGVRPERLGATVDLLGREVVARLQPDPRGGAIQQRS